MQPPSPYFLSNPAATAQDRRLCLLLGGLLFAIYLLVYTGIPSTIDGKATLTVTSSFLKHGTPDIAIMGSAEALLPPLARMGTFGADGLLYAKKGVVPSLVLLPLVGLAHIIPDLPIRATAMLLNPLVTSMTAMLLYTFARWLGYRPRTAFIGALTYGLATFALVYTITLFGEPLAALLLLAAVMAAWRFRQQPGTTALLLSGLSLGLLLGINLTYALMAPLIGLYAFGVDPRRWRLPQIIRMAGPFLLVVGGLLAYNAIRFGGLFESGYNFAEGEGFTTNFGVGVFGLLISPYRGMVWFNPVMLLAVPGTLLMRQRHARLTAVVLAVAAAQVAAYASWWSWHGGIVWGPRFLIPVTPLLVLLLLPVIDRIPRNRLMTAAFAILGTLSLLIQLVAGVFSFIPHVIHLYVNYATNVVDGFFIDFDPEIIYRVDLSPVLAQFGIAFSGEPLQPILLQSADIIHALLVLIIAAAAVIVYHYAKQTAHLVLAVIVILGAAIGIAGRQQKQLTMTRAVQQNLRPSDLLIAASTDYDENLIDLPAATRVITTNAPTPPDDPLATGLWDYAMQQSGLAWFITWYPPASADNWQERDLWQQASFVQETLFEENRALLFDLNPPAPADQPGGWLFDTIELADYGILRDDDGIRAALVWQSEAPSPPNFRWFVHLVDAQGQIVQQQDRVPQGGYPWQDGETAQDYLFFPLPAATSTADWQLRIGWVNADNGERLPAYEPDGTSIADGFILLPVE